MNDRSHRTLTIVVGAVAALGGITALLTYIEMRKMKALKEQILVMDAEIKQLELLHKRKKVLDEHLDNT